MTEDLGRSARPAINSFLDSVGQLIVTAIEMVHTRLELVFLPSCRRRWKAWSG